MLQDPKEGLQKGCQGRMAPVPREQAPFPGRCKVARAVLELRAAPQIPVIPRDAGVSSAAALRWNGTGQECPGEAAGNCQELLLVYTQRSSAAHTALAQHLLQVGTAPSRAGGQAHRGHLRQLARWPQGTAG